VQTFRKRRAGLSAAAGLSCFSLQITAIATDFRPQPWRWLWPESQIFIDTDRIADYCNCNDLERRFR